MNDNNKEFSEIKNDKKIINNEETPKNKSNTFNLIIGIATLLIALLGATFAYFSATARSKENDVSVKSAYVSISYDGGTEIKATNLIPASETVAINKFQKEVASIGTIDDDSLEFLDEDEYTNDTTRRCVDAKGREVCYVYQFSINSDGVEGGTTSIAGSIKINSNEFSNLSYLLYEVTFEQENGQDKVDKFGNRIVQDYTLVGTFDQTDNNPDNVNYTDTKFAKLEKPFDKFGSNGEYVSTIYPLACLFGYSDTHATDEADQISRCSNITITNNVKHTYQLMIWLEETGDLQEEQGLSFEGTVQLEVPIGQEGNEYGDGKITGKE